MKIFITNLFLNYSTLIVFIHILSAIIWIGGMVVIRFIIHPILQDINKDIKIRITLKILKKFFNFLIPFIILIVISAMFLAIGLGFKGTPLYDIIHIKEGIWTIMLIVFIIAYRKLAKAENFLSKRDLKEVKKQLVPLAKYLIPINIILGITALYLGIILRGL